MAEVKTHKCCSKCKVEKPLEEYFKRKESKDGRRANCKECCGIVANQYYKNNKEGLRAINKKWRQDNPEKSQAIYAKYRKTDKRKKVANAWAKRNQRRQIDRFVERYHSDPMFNLAIKYRRRIYMALKGDGYTKKAKSTLQLLGISYEKFKIHIERQFTKGMSWDKMFNGEIHLDHIQPLSAAKNQAELENLFHYTNLRPMWATDNLEKHDKIIEHQMKLAI